MERIDVDGMSMSWLEEGQGDPVVVLVHGIPTGAALWRKVLPQLHGVRAIAWEMPGYGKSIPEGRNRDISVSAQARYLRAFLHRMEIPRAVLVGHDIGGGVVQVAALREPGLCEGLLLTNAVGYDSWPVPAIKAVARFGPVLDRVLPKALFGRLFVASMKGAHDDPEVARESGQVHWASYQECDGAAAFIRQARALDVHDTLAVQDALPTLRTKPTRVVWGAADAFQKVGYAHRFARDLDAPLELIEGGKHFTPEDHPDVLARAILDLCEEVRRGREPQVGAKSPS